MVVGQSVVPADFDLEVAVEELVVVGPEKQQVLDVLHSGFGGFIGSGGSRKFWL